MTDDEVPEYDDPGEAFFLLATSPDYAEGCTNQGHSPCNCIIVGVKGQGGLYVPQIMAGAKAGAHTVDGRWRVTRNGSLFVRSGVVTLPNDGQKHWWKWCNKDANGVCRGWTFNDGDELCGGFWLTTGGWVGGGGPACETVQG